MGTTDDSTTRVKGDSATPVHITNSSLPGFGGSGGAVTIADGADGTQGSKADAAAASDTESTSLVGLFKRLLQRLTTLLNGGLPAALGQGTMAQSMRVVLPSDQTGANAVQIRNGAAASFADTVSNTQLNVLDSAGTGRAGLGSFPHQYNGATWDRLRGQEEIALLASAARTATTSANLTLYNNCAVLLVVDVTARAGATTLTPSLVMGQSGFVANKTIWTAAAAINTASGTTMYVFWPLPTNGSPTGYAEVINAALFREMQVTITHSDGSSITYSVTAYTAAL